MPLLQGLDPVPAFAAPAPILSRGSCHSRSLRPLFHSAIPFRPLQSAHLQVRALTDMSGTGRPPLRCDPTVYFVADVGVSEGRDLPTIVRDAVRGGAGIVQYRDKSDATPAEKEAFAKSLRDAVREASPDAAFLVNDDPALAVRVAADGVHVGQDDAALAEARAVVGEKAIIGVSCGNIAEAEAAIAGGADYLGVGAVFETKSKPDAGEPLGIGGLARIVQAVSRRVPVVAIGGINMGNCGGCAVVGADGLAVISTIVKSGDPKVEAEMLRMRFEDAHFDREEGGKPAGPVTLDFEAKATY